MKRMNRLIAVLLAALLAFSCAVAGFAAENQQQPSSGCWKPKKARLSPRPL